LISLNSPVVVCGDLRGHFPALLEIFQTTGRVRDTNYLLLGNYVSRGTDSVEVITLLLMLKLRYPNRVTLLRGNQECRQLTQVYGFYDECLKKYGDASVWEYFLNVFDFLPLAAVLDDKVFCVHGGLSPHFETIDEIMTLDRIGEVPTEGLLCDLLWDNPDDTGWGISPKGAGCAFGADIVKEFNHRNEIFCIARAHEFVMDGYKWMSDSEDLLVTIFSVPNYSKFNNKGAIWAWDEHSNNEFHLFAEAPSS
jgi:serine/threonine-protein phosphatase 2A catalytic subunit